MINPELLAEQEAIFQKALAEAKARGDLAAIFFEGVSTKAESPDSSEKGKYYEGLRSFEDDRWTSTFEGFCRMENRKRRPYSWMTTGPHYNPDGKFEN
jgi:hypothetical protein